MAAVTSELLGLAICFELHASNRSLEREINVVEIKQLIDNPKTKCLIQKNGRLKFTHDQTVVIGEVRKSCLWIITAYHTNRKEKL